MRRLLLISLFLLAASPAFAAITRVQAPAGCASPGNGSSCSVTLTSTTSGNAVIVTAYSGDGATPVISDNLSSTYHLDKSQVSTEGVFIWSLLNAPSGITSITCQPNAGSGFVICFAAEYSGIATASAYDVGIGNTSTSTTDYTSTAVSTTNADDLLIGIWGTGFSASVTGTAGSGWTYPATEVHQTYDGDTAQWQERIVSSTGSYQANGTLDESLTRIQVVMAAYKAAGGAASAARRRIINP